MKAIPRRSRMETLIQERRVRNIQFSTRHTSGEIANLLATNIPTLAGVNPSRYFFKRVFNVHASYTVTFWSRHWNCHKFCLLIFCLWIWQVCKIARYLSKGVDKGRHCEFRVNLITRYERAVLHSSSTTWFQMKGNERWFLRKKSYWTIFLAFFKCSLPMSASKNIMMER